MVRDVDHEVVAFAGDLELVSSAAWRLGLGILPIVESLEGARRKYHNLSTSSGMVDEVRMEIYTKKQEVEAIATAITDAARTGLPGDGIVAVLQVEDLFLIALMPRPPPPRVAPRLRHPFEHACSVDCLPVGPRGCLAYDFDVRQGAYPVTGWT